MSKPPFPDLIDEEAAPLVERLTEFNVKMAELLAYADEETLLIAAVEASAALVPLRAAWFVHVDDEDHRPRAHALPAGPQSFRGGRRERPPDEVLERALERRAVGPVDVLAAAPPGSGRGILGEPSVAPRVGGAGATAWHAVPLHDELNPQPATLLLELTAEGAAELRREAALITCLESFGGTLLRLLADLSVQRDVRATAQVLDRVVESLPHATVVVDGEEERMLAWNANAEFLFGFRRVLALGESYASILPADLVETVADLLAATRVGSDVVERDVEHRLDDATVIRVGVSCAPLTDRDGTRRGFVLIFRDRSLAMEMERLEEANRLKTDFVEAVSHEFKTPLTSILGTCEILGFEKETLSADVVDSIDTIERGARRLRELVADLLDVARLEGGRVVLERNRCDPTALVADAVEAGEVYAKGGSHTFDLRIDDDLGRPLWDSAKVRQVLVNLMTNAVKYSPEGGSVRVTVERRDDESGLDSIRFRVKDEGLGIPAAKLRRIWEKFVRIHPRGTAPGTGLGLAITKLIVELHGGRIDVASEGEGKGSTFTVWLPA